MFKNSSLLNINFKRPEGFDWASVRVGVKNVRST